jgi:tetratricopeptide (TPR) repeat protein
MPADQGSVTDSATTADQTAPPTSGDELLDRFNRANTSQEWGASHKLAAEIARDPSTPRRQLALAIDAYNCHEYGEAERWSRSALQGSLPSASAETASLIRGRALINLKRAKEALRALQGVGPMSHLGWFVPAARADAYIELHDPAKAIAESERALEMAPDVPEVHYHAARTAWHADRVWDALDHIARYRAVDPANLDGLLLHGSILGFLGSSQRDAGALRYALGLFTSVLPTDNCEAIRLCAVTAARLGNWEQAFSVAKQLLEHRGVDGSGHCPHTDGGHDHAHFVYEHIIPDAFEALGEHDAAEVERAASEAERLFGPSDFLASQKALALALRGDLDGTLAVLGRTRATIAKAPVGDQIALAAALYMTRDYAGAYEIMRRIKKDLARPEGLLRLAECAAAAGEVDAAHAVLVDLADSEDLGGQVARLSLAILQAEMNNARKTLDLAADLRWYSIGANAVEGSPRLSLWEGRHHPTTPMVDTMPYKLYLN